MIPRATENTVTTLLKEKLEKHKLNVQPFASIRTPVGRREVDLICTNAGVYPIEAKFTERDSWKFISYYHNNKIPEGNPNGDA